MAYSMRGGHRVMHEERRLPIESVLMNIVYFVFGVIEALLAIRFVLLLLGANPNAGFSQLIYALSAPFMMPFQAVFGDTVMRGVVFEWSALLAILVYALLAWGIASLITAVSPRASASTTEIVEDVQRTDEHTASAHEHVESERDHVHEA